MKIKLAILSYVITTTSFAQEWKDCQNHNSLYVKDQFGGANIKGIGIGTNNPSARLDVFGRVKLHSTLILDTALNIGSNLVLNGQAGTFKNTTWVGTGNRLLQTDANGNIIVLPAGTSNQVLLGNGTWGSMPTPVNMWQQNGAGVYYTGGKVGIGTNNPLLALDIIGDARVSNNLYVGGGIVITDKVNANLEIKTFDIKVDNDLSVESNARLKGNNRFDNGFTFDGINGILFTPATATQGGIFYLGNASKKPLAIPQCLGGNVITNYFNQQVIDGSFISRVVAGAGTGSTNSSLTMFSAPWDGNGFIEVEGVDNNGHGSNGLYLNHFCSRNTHINTNWDIANGRDGGTVFLGAKVDMQQSMRIGAAGSPISLNTSIEIDQALNNANVIKVNTSNPTIKVLSILRVDGKNPFIVYGDGKTQIGVEKFTTGPHIDAMLTVDGKIVSKSCYVTQQNWADFVFDKNYALPKLSDIENYYKQYGHLPQIPSAQEVKENGIDVGEMNKLLLQKIEELTILMVEQEKRIKNLESKK